MAIAFNLDIEGLGACRMVLNRDALPPGGDFEDAFFSGIREPSCYGGSLARAITDSASRPGTCWVVVVRNPALVLDGGLPARLAAVVADLEEAPVPVSIAAAAGLSRNGERVSALYCARAPRLPVDTLRLPLIDPAPDLWIADAGFLASLGNEMPLGAIETIVAATGWCGGRMAIYDPRLGAGIDGAMLTRDRGYRTELRKHLSPRLGMSSIDTLDGPVALDGTGSVTLEDTMNAIVRQIAGPLSLSLVVRTRFERPHLLDRLLASIARARLDDAMDLEVVISTDREDPGEAFGQLEKDHPYLALKLTQNASVRHSRVDNLLGGITAATGRQVAVIDDDDYVDLFAFERVRQASFLNAETLIFAPSSVHEETWEITPSGRALLTRSVPRLRYPADGWRTLWKGMNTLPVCSFIAPRAWLVGRLSAFDFAHDLSEDYALVLLMLTAPDLPPIQQLPGTFAHISLRGAGENATTMQDRRAWTADISAYLNALARDGRVCGAGTWRLLAALAEGRAAEAEPEPPEPSVETARLRRELALLQGDRDRLRRQLADVLSRDPSRASAPAIRKHPAREHA